MASISTLKLEVAGSFRSVLRHLEAEDIQRFCLRPVQFEAGQRIGLRGHEVRHIAFLESGAASLMVSFQDGKQAEAAFLDSESIIGLSALLGDTVYLHDVVMQAAGVGYVCRRDEALEEFARSNTFQRVALNCARAQMAETTELVGCYAAHEVPQRLSRWLLTYQDRTRREEIAITQEVLSQILSATRPTISMVSEMFARRGILQVRRGKIRILDRAALEAEACGCYRTLRRFRGEMLPAIGQVPHRLPDTREVLCSDETFSSARGTVGREGIRRSGCYVQ